MIKPVGLAHESAFILCVHCRAFAGATLFMLVVEYERDGPVGPLTQISSAIRRWRGDPAQVAADVRRCLVLGIQRKKEPRNARG
jgi:hypothetical protein